MTDRGSKYDRAESYAAQKRYEEAITLYKELIAEHPGEDSLRLSLAWIYRDSGRIGEAIALFESLLEKGKNWPEMFLPGLPTMNWSGYS